MNIWGYKQKLKRARDMIRAEENRKRPEIIKIKRIKENMRRTRKKIRDLKEIREQKRKGK